MLDPKYIPLFIGGFIAWICFMIFVGWITSRGKNEGSSFLTGGGNLGFFLIFCTVGATMIGTGSSMGAIGNGFNHGWGGAIYGLGASAGILSMLLFTKAKNKGFLTMSEEAQYYYGGKKIIRQVMGFMMFVIEIIWLGNHLNGGAKYLAYVTQMPDVTCKIITVLGFGIYVFIGGYMAVVTTDAVQFIAILIGFLTIAFRAIPPGRRLPERGGYLHRRWQAWRNDLLRPGLLRCHGCHSTGLVHSHGRYRPPHPPYPYLHLQGRKDRSQGLPGPGHGQYNAADQTQHYCVANAALCLGDFVLPKADADEGAAAVTDHYGNGQRYHRQGENDRIGGVAIRAKIAGVCNKDLVHDVVQRTYKQRNNARDRVFLHQLADALRAKELIGTFHGIHLYLSILGQTKTTGSPHATGFTHEGYSLYEIIIACPPGICKGSFAQDLYWAFCADCTRQTLWKMPCAR